MSDYKVNTDGGFVHDELAERLVKLSDEKLPDWAVILMDKDGSIWAYNSADAEMDNGKWGFRSWLWREAALLTTVANIGLDWTRFGIFRTGGKGIRHEAKPPKRGKKSEQIELVSAYAAQLERELSATRAMLEEAQKEIAELQSQPIPPHVQQSWYEDGWGDGAADMLKAAQMAEAGLIGEYNASHESMDTVRGAAFVVGAIANAFQQGRRVNLERLTAEGEGGKI